MQKNNSFSWFMLLLLASAQRSNPGQRMTGMVVAQADFCILIAANKLKQLMADVRIKDNTILSGEKYLLKRVRSKRKRKTGAGSSKKERFSIMGMPLLLCCIIKNIVLLFLRGNSGSRLF